MTINASNAYSATASASVHERSAAGTGAGDVVASGKAVRPETMEFCVPTAGAEPDVGSTDPRGGTGRSGNPGGCGQILDAYA